MLENVLYIVKSNLHYYPPCVSQIRILRDLGIQVTVAYGSSDKGIVESLTGEGIKCIELTDPRGKAPGVLDKVVNWISFRKALSKKLKSIDKEKTLLWFGNAETALPMWGSLNGFHYVITYLELLDTHPKRIKMLKRMSQRAEAIITCEETRSYIMKYWFDLQDMPYTIPNKPYSLSIKKNSIPTTDKGKDILSKVGNHKFVIYQGIFQNLEYLEVFAKVLYEEYPDTYFVMMGIDRRNVVDKIKKINPNTISTDYIPAPLHLEVTSNADIGLLFYDPDTLNKAFCAPNKIFEYSFFGLPIIGNNIPGLSNTIGRANAGICTEFTYDSISKALKEIYSNYSVYSNNAYKFYDSVNNVKTIEKIVEKIGINQ